MIARGAPAIGWGDLAAALAFCIQPAGAAQAATRAEALWGTGTLACASVRSGFDLVLAALSLPPGSEVLVSAITIPGMIEILEHHDLVAVPVDLDCATLAVEPASLERAITPRTKAMLLAHLFGSRMPLNEITTLAQRYNLLLFEDCAQAYDGSGYRGHPASDLSMFSFGPIKTATALGGGLLRLRDPTLLARAQAIQAGYPPQSCRRFARRVLLFALLKLAALPPLFLLLVLGCRLGRRDEDRLISSAVRGFGSGPLIPRIRQRPCAPLLRLLARRIAHPPHSQIAARAALALAVRAQLPPHMRVGAGAATHCHWVLPVLAHDPEALVGLLRAYGLDATRRASSLALVAPSAGQAETPQAAHLINQIVYLPLGPGMSAKRVTQLGRIRAATGRQISAKIEG